MQAESFGSIFLNAAIVNNFVLALFLGICPFLGVSAKKETAWNMGMATLFVMLVSSMSAYAINWILGELDLMFLRLICYIAVIASAVQLVEMFIKASRSWVSMTWRRCIATSPPPWSDATVGSRDCSR